MGGGGEGQPAGSCMGAALTRRAALLGILAFGDPGRGSSCLPGPFGEFKVTMSHAEPQATARLTLEMSRRKVGAEVASAASPSSDEVAPEQGGPGSSERCPYKTWTRTQKRRPWDVGVGDAYTGRGTPRVAGSHRPLWAAGKDQPESLWSEQGPTTPRPQAGGLQIREDGKLLGFPDSPLVGLYPGSHSTLG